MKPIDRLLQILDEGAFITSEEMAELAREVRALKQDAWREIQHYAAEYSQDGPVEIYEVTRRRVEGQQSGQKTNEPNLAQGKTMENITTVTPVDHNLADPTQADLADPIFEAIWQAIKEWDLSRNGGIGASYAGATGTDVMTVLIQVRQTLVDWAVDQWRKQVESRPLNNMHRRSLDDVWRQVIRRMGADDVSLIGPTHDELLKEMK